MKWMFGNDAVLVLAILCFPVSNVVSGREQQCTMSIVESIPENLTYSSESPSHGSTYDGWISLLRAATSTVDITSYYWTLRGHGNISDITDKQGSNIFNALSELKSHKVALRIIQSPPSEEYPNLDSKAFQDMGVAKVQNLDITKLLGNGILHTKLWVVDSKHFYMGSANMDWRSLTQVKELGLLGVDCEVLAQDFQRLFDIYWYLSTPGTSLPPGGVWPDQYTAQYNMSNPAAISINNSLSSSAFLASSPPQLCASKRTNDIDALLDVISTAKTFVYVAVMDYVPAVVFVKDKYYWSRIDVALRAAAYSGVTVRLMGSYWNHTSEDMLHFLKSLSDDTHTGHNGIIETRLFQVPSLTTKNIPFTRVNHNKYMVTDNAAYVGTSNWSGDYFISTGGISCTVRSTETAKLHSTSSLQTQLKEVFERDWYSPYTSNTTLSAADSTLSAC